MGEGAERVSERVSERINEELLKLFRRVWDSASCTCAMEPYLNTNSLPSYGCLKLIPCGELGGNDDGVIAGGLFAPEQVHAREFAEHDGGVWRLELRSLRRLHYFTLSTIVRCFAEWGAAAVLAFLPLLALFATWQPLVG